MSLVDANKRVGVSLVDANNKSGRVSSGCIYDILPVHLKFRIAKSLKNIPPPPPGDLS